MEWTFWECPNKRGEKSARIIIQPLGRKETRAASLNMTPHKSEIFCPFLQVPRSSRKILTHQQFSFDFSLSNHITFSQTQTG
jgi:hypothetical protein